jgi:hypothetical protein
MLRVTNQMLALQLPVTQPSIVLVVWIQTVMATQTPPSLGDTTWVVMLSLTSRHNGQTETVMALERIQMALLLMIVRPFVILQASTGMVVQIQMVMESPTLMETGPLLMVQMHVFPVLGTLQSTALVALMETVMATRTQQAIGL